VWAEAFSEVTTATGGYNSGSANVPGLRHEHSSVVSVRTYQYQFFSESTRSEIGKFPDSASAYHSLAIFARPCNGCKTIQGSSNLRFDQNLFVWPTVASKSVNVSPSGMPIEGQLRIIDALGRLVTSMPLSDDSDLEIDVTGFTAGTYMVCVTNADLVRAAKFIVTH
jgi:hypothetical protein